MLALVIADQREDAKLLGREPGRTCWGHKRSPNRESSSRRPRMTGGQSHAPSLRRPGREDEPPLHAEATPAVAGCSYGRGRGRTHRAFGPAATSRRSTPSTAQRPAASRNAQQTVPSPVRGCRIASALCRGPRRRLTAEGHPCPRGTPLLDPAHTREGSEISWEPSTRASLLAMPAETGRPITHPVLARAGRSHVGVPALVNVLYVHTLT